MSAIEYVLRVRKARSGDGYTCSLRRFAATHPEVRAVLGPVVHGQGATEPAAMLAAITAARVDTVPAVREVPRHGC